MIAFNVITTLKTVHFAIKAPQGLGLQMVNSLLLAFSTTPNTLLGEIQLPLTLTLLYAKRIQSMSKVGLKRATLVLPKIQDFESIIPLLDEIPSLERLSVSGCSINQFFKFVAAFNRQTAEPTRHISHLVLQGKNYFVPWVLTCLAPRNLHSFVGKFESNCGQLATPHVLDYLLEKSHSSLEEISLSGTWDADRSLSDAQYQSWEAFAPAKLSKGFFPSLPSFRRLTALRIQSIPFIDPTFPSQLTAHIHLLPALQSFYFIPVRWSHLDRHQMILPTLDTLQNISLHMPSLHHLTLAMDISSIPCVEALGLRRLIPGHALKTFFIIPYYRDLESISYKELVALSVYVDYLFPNLEDVTSYFEEGGEGVGKAGSAGAAKVWGGVWASLKSYQALRAGVMEAIYLGR